MTKLQGGMMKRTFILCLFLFLGGLSGSCATTFPPLQPVRGAAINDYSNNLANAADPFVTQANENYPNITKIENSIFGRTYAGQNIASRLSRIEKSLFTTTYPNSNTTQRIDNIISNFNQINKNPNISRNDLTKIEAKVFNQTYPQNSPERRIERLEQQLLGAVQSGDLNTRYENIKTASKCHNSNNYSAADLQAQGTRGVWQGLTQAMGGSMFGGGMMTGFTPPIAPFNNNYSSGYGNNNYNNYNAYSNSNTNSYASAYPSGSGMYRGNRTNHGYQDSFQDYSSGAGVTILD